MNTDGDCGNEAGARSASLSSDLFVGCEVLLMD